VSDAIAGESRTTYKTALDAAIREYESLGAQRREIDNRLAQLAQTIGTLNRLLGFVPTVPLGLTDACRLALRGAGLPLTPLDVRDRLLAIGIDLSAYANELSAIHTTLKRLNDAGEIRQVTKARGKAAYVWNVSTETASSWSVPVGTSIASSKEDAVKRFERAEVKKRRRRNG